MVVPLDRLQEQSRPVLHYLGEDLKQVALVIIVDQNVQLLGDGGAGSMNRRRVRCVHCSANATSKIPFGDERAEANR